MMGARGFLKREGFDFDKNPSQIDKAFLKLFSKAEAEEIRSIWMMMQMGAGPTRLYGMPRTLQQAHLLMSHDRHRYVPGFEWLAGQVDSIRPKAVLEVGCGTGMLLRYLAENFPEIRYQGIDAVASLVNAAPATAGIHLEVGDYLTQQGRPEFDLIICNFGFDAERFAPSKKPHSIAQIGNSKFCPGCSDDLADELRRYFGAWRNWATKDARLLMVGRIGNFGFLRAMALAAGDAGWVISTDESTVLDARDPDGDLEHYPAIRFVSEANGAVNLEQLEAELFGR